MPCWALDVMKYRQRRSNNSPMLYYPYKGRYNMVAFQKMQQQIMSHHRRSLLSTIILYNQITTICVMITNTKNIDHVV